MTDDELIRQLRAEAERQEGNGAKYLVALPDLAAKALEAKAGECQRFEAWMAANTPPTLSEAEHDRLVRCWQAGVNVGVRWRLRFAQVVSDNERLRLDCGQAIAELDEAGIRHGAADTLRAAMAEGGPR